MESKMTVIITMAGLGSRFRKVGYGCPKYMIEAKGKTLFEWSLDSLLDYNSYVGKYVFVVRKEDKAVGFIRDKCRKYKIKAIDIVELEQMTDGQATTCMCAMPYCDEDVGILIYNIDTYVEPYEMKFSDICGDGHIPCFYGDGSHWSFVKTDIQGNAIEVKEKERISKNCTLGAYYFSSAGLYRQLYEEYYAKDGKMVKGEKYIAPLYNHLIEKGMQVTISIIEKVKVHALGTPEELEVFLSESN